MFFENFRKHSSYRSVLLRTGQSKFSNAKKPFCLKRAPEFKRLRIVLKHPKTQFLHLFFKNNSLISQRTNPKSSRRLKTVENWFLGLLVTTKAGETSNHNWFYHIFFRGLLLREQWYPDIQTAIWAYPGSRNFFFCDFFDWTNIQAHRAFFRQRVPNWFENHKTAIRLW